MPQTIKEGKDEEAMGGLGLGGDGYGQPLDPNMIQGLEQMTDSEKLNLLEIKKTELSDLFKIAIGEAEDNRTGMIYEKTWSMRAYGTIPQENIHLIDKP
jgi:hypothetical protein